MEQSWPRRSELSPGRPVPTQICGKFPRLVPIHPKRSSNGPNGQPRTKTAFIAQPARKALHNSRIGIGKS